MTGDTLIERLGAAGLITTGPVRVRPLTGGVSSEVYAVETGAARFVVKTALARLNVRDDWFADVSRNGVERRYLEYAAGIVPEAVPRILGGNADEGWFAMEFFEAGYANWKQQLLEGRVESIQAERAGEFLGRIHRASWHDPHARTQFDTLANFHALRVEPYLLTTASRCPEVSDLLRTEADRLAATRVALVHGDFSPKNILVSSQRVIVLDAECGWFGDPAFDAAFLLNHLHLKALFPAARAGGVLDLVAAFWSAYVRAVGTLADPAFEHRTTRLLLCLMLARVHGKSPAEYLATEAQRRFVTEFAIANLHRPPAKLAELAAQWRHSL